jgi:putative ABC transport system permease protein
MRFKAHVNEAVRSLCTAKQRTGLALIGIVIGIASVIAMVSVGAIVQNEALQQFKELGTDILTIEKDATALLPVNKEPDSATGMQKTVAGKKSANATFRLDDVMAIPNNCSSIILVAPSTRINGGELINAGKKLECSYLMGVTESFAIINKFQMKSGRFLSDLDEQSQFCVVGSGISSELQRQGVTDVLGEKIRVGNSIFTVVGVIEEVRKSAQRFFEPNVSVFVHITTGLRLAKDAEINAITAKVRPGVDNNSARKQVTDYFAAKTTSPLVRISSPEDIIAQMKKQMQMFRVLLGAIGSISLVVGGIGVMNVMLVSVTERRREIGIRRALGAKRSDILNQFLIESVILTMIGGFLGVFLGISCSRIISHFAHWQFLLSISSIILGVGVSTVVGIFFGIYPARQASQLDPIVALRSE